MSKINSKIITTAFEKPKSDENSLQVKKPFTPKGPKNPIDTHNKNVKPFMPIGFYLIISSSHFFLFFQFQAKRETYNLTPNITPIKDVVADKKILVRSFSKGNLNGIPQQNVKNTLTVSTANSALKKSEKVSSNSTYGMNNLENNI